MRRFWRLGLAVVTVTCVLASVLAYLGRMRLEVAGVPHVDFVGHLVFTAMLAFFADGVVGRRRLGARAFPVGPAAVLGVAGLDEVLQRFSTCRSSTLSDFVADAIGVTIGALAASRVSVWLTAPRCSGPGV